MCLSVLINPSVLPFSFWIIPWLPLKGSTHPATFRRFWCWLFVGTKGLLTFLCPHSSQLGMKTKSRFITKEHHSLYAAFLKFEEFFLTSHDTLLSPHWSLEHTGAMDAAN